MPKTRSRRHPPSRTPCLGPITHAGCDALCPTYHRGCFGCFGPAESPNPRSLTARLEDLGTPRAEVVRLLRTFNAAADAFREESESLLAAEEAP